MHDTDDSGAAWLDAINNDDWPGAFAINDQVLASRDPATCDDPSLPYHLRWVWDGTPPDGRDVLVRCYHGLGDTLQFARYLPVLAARAARLTVEAQPELLPILAPLPGPIRLVPFDPAAPTPPGDVCVEIMETAHMLRLPPDAASPPYLGAEAIPTGAIGLCWQAGAWNPDRSIPLAMLAGALPDRTDLISLQRGPGAAEARLPGAPVFLNPHDGSTDILHTAGLIRGAALVVTVDTMVAHLAGALGHPTWLLLKHEADWRWLRRGAKSRWYPRTTLFRQVAVGDWSEPLRAIRTRCQRDAGFQLN
jgi:hypothetical protein